MLDLELKIPLTKKLIIDTLCFSITNELNYRRRTDVINVAKNLLYEHGINYDKYIGSFPDTMIEIAKDLANKLFKDEIEEEMRLIQELRKGVSNG